MNWLIYQGLRHFRDESTKFTSSSITTDQENFVEVLQKLFDILHTVDSKRVELFEYQLKGITKVLLDQWKRNTLEDALIVSWDVFENSLMGHFIPL